MYAKGVLQVVNTFHEIETITWISTFDGDFYYMQEEITEGVLALLGL
jgi:hypothetical protein